MTPPDDLARTSAPPAATDGSTVASGTNGIVGLVLAILSLQGQGSWTTAIQAVFGYQMGPDQFRMTMAVSGLVTLGFAVAGVVLGRRASASSHAGLPSQYVGRAAVVLGVIGALVSTVTVVGSLLAPSGQSFGPMM